MFASGMSLLRTACVGAMLLAALAAPAAAQTAVTGAVWGTVRTTDGAPLGDALVTLVDAKSGARYQTVSTREGTYRIARLPTGDYSAIAEQIGYAPAFLTGVPIRPGVELEVPVTLRAGGPAELVLDSAVFQAGAAALGRVAASRWLGEGVLSALPFAAPEFVEAARLVSWMDRDLGAEGLPGSFSAVALEGHVLRSASHPLLAPEGRRGGLLLAPVAVGGADITRSAVDGEWSSPAGTVVSALARRGAEDLVGVLGGQISAGPLANAGFFDRGSLSPRALRGVVRLEGAAFGDSARFSIGADIRSDEVALSPAWGNDALNAAIAAAGGWIGPLATNLEPQLLTQRSVAAYGQLDWRIAAGQRLGLTVAGSVPADRPATAPGSGRLDLIEGTDLLAGLNLFTDLGSVANQLRLSWTQSLRQSFGTAPTAVGVVVPAGLRLNGNEAARSEESTITLFDAIHFRSGSHGFKVGGDLAMSTYDQAWRAGAVAQYLFGGLAQLEESRGVFQQTTGAAPTLNWTGREYGFFLQDTWRDDSGLGITAVLRVSRYDVSDTPARDAEWFRLFTFANDLEPDNALRFSPRLDVSWPAGEQQQFVVNATAGLYHDRINPLLVGDWLLDDGSAQVSRHIGGVGVWTTGRPAAATSHPRLTLPGSPLRGPETAKAAAGFAYAVGEATTIAFNGGYRHTRFLPRRSDLNLAPAPRAEDQYGRPVFGALEQQGALVVATPGSNRRFDSYDEVTALNLDGWSTWYGGTVSVERTLAQAFSLGASYTYSRTRDNWFGAAAGGWVGTPPPDLGLSQDWSEADSDFDVPHRGTLFAAWTSPYGLSVSGVYRYESGRPFTPGFDWGVDVNGDGISGNDPAFVDPALPGISELVAQWPCLRLASGAIAERNSCRADASHTLDARVELRLPAFEGLEVSARAELIDLLETDFSLPDAALYRIDPEQSLVYDGVEGTVSIPLLVNPAFGERLVRARAGRSLRLGLALTW